MFIDEASIIVKGGHGGSGMVNFRREAHVPRGGPDGGDGGRGGSVILRASIHKHTFLDIMQKTIYQAEDGKNGMPKLMSGKNGKDVVIELPLGTIIRDEASSELLCDLVEENQEYVAARGGKGGRGNAAFTSSTHQTPRECEEGRAGGERHLALELKLIADVGLVGLPNAGKSTLLSRVSKAHPKIASYPFTTLEPELGIIDLGDFRRLVMVDLPGLIEGAHKGIGLGDEFLRHIERTRIIIHLVDVGDENAEEPLKAYQVIREELRLYSETLAQKPEIIVGTKMDVPAAAERLAELRKETGKEILGISSATGLGLRELLLRAVKEVDKCFLPST
jgi:GTPase